MRIPKASVLFGLFGKAVPPQFFGQLRERLSLSARGIYSLAVVVWLMMWQRLDGRGSLAVAVQQVVQGALGDLVPPEKRVREQRVSSNTGALSRARKRLPREVVEAVCDEIFAQLMTPREGNALLERLFLLDGSSMRLAHTASLVAAYPPGSNQHGEAHWPVIRLVAAHHLSSGLATRPCWGPFYGEQAVSEQGLAEEIMPRLPADAALMGDRNFAVFSVAWAAQQHGYAVLFRMTEVRARKLAGGVLPPAGSERRVEWRPSRDDRRAHPQLPTEALVRGRLLVAHVEGEDRQPLKLYLFTTLEEPREVLVELYPQRWDIGVSSQGHIVQSVRDRPRSKDSGLVAGEAPWRESQAAEPSDNILRKEYAQRTRLQRAVNADVASLHESPVAETVDNARKQQGLAETSPIRQLSPAGYQRRHGVKEDVETGETLGARRRNLAEEMPAITVSGKCRHRHQGDGSGRSTADGRAAKRARREGPGPVSIPSVKGRQG